MKDCTSKLLEEPTRLKSYILGIYRDILIKLPVGSKERETLMKRFNYLKDRPDYYWCSFFEI
tara:strand:+ start:738 stop:923 length:186 start_codon:yes stop_codon:yes gene_type:complete